MNLNDVLCVIPARGGSKGIPGKNLRLLGGIPLVAHSILHARIAGFAVENIILSSNDDAILKCSTYGATPLKRPEEISGDESSTELALLHACNCNNKAKHVLLLQATSPMRLPSTVEGFLQFYLENDYDSALTATEFHDFFWYVQRHGKWNEEAKQWIPTDCWKSTYRPDNRPMRQSLSFGDNKFFDNGNAYLMSVEMLTARQCRLGGKVGVYPISELEGMQIDTPGDLLLFENIFDGKMSKMTGVESK